MMLLNCQGLSGVPPARGEKGKKTGIKKYSEMEMFHFLTYKHEDTKFHYGTRSSKDECSTGHQQGHKMGQTGLKYLTKSG